MDNKTAHLRANINDEDIKEIVDTIIDDNKFDRKLFFKECGLMTNLKKVKLDHLAEICKTKGYRLVVQLPEDTITISYYLENQEVEKENPPLDELGEDESELDFI